MTRGLSPWVTAYDPAPGGSRADVLYAARVAHMPRDPTPGAIRKEAECADCGRLTTHVWVRYEGDAQSGERDGWHWVCTGLSAEERAAGK